MKENFAIRLSWLRHDKKISQHALAKIVGVTQKAIDF